MQVVFCYIQIEIDVHIVVLRTRQRFEGGILDPFRKEALHIDLGTAEAVSERSGLGQNTAVLCNHVGAGEGAVRAGLSAAGGGIDIAAQHSGRLSAHQLPAVLELTHHLVACRCVGHDGGSCHGMEGARRQRGPEILTDFHP